MPALTTDFGEEWWSKNDVTTTTPDITLYNQTSDGLGESSDVGDITTEPTGSSYSRVTGISVSFNSFSDGTHGIQNDNTLSFDTSDSSQNVDHVAIIADVGGTDRLVGITPLNNLRDLSNFAEITLEPGNLTYKAD